MNSTVLALNALTNCISYGVDILLSTYDSFLEWTLFNVDIINLYAARKSDSLYLENLMLCTER
jgi:hypothetical protein